MTSRFARDLTLRQLRALGAVQATGSITSAANRLALTQPAVTLQLRNLQALAGLPLIQRTGSGMVLTDVGRTVLALAERVELALLDCEQTLDMIAGRTGGRVSIGAVSTAKYFVPFMIAAFSQRYREIEVTLTIGNRQEIHAALRGYDLDIAIMGQPPADLEVEMHSLGEHPHVIVAPAGHPLSKRRTCAPSELAGETFISREGGSGTRMLMERFFEKHGLTPRIGLEAESNETIKQSVLAGLGIAFISQHTVAHELDEGRLVAVKLEGFPVMRHWHAIRRSDKVLLPAAQAMLEFLGSEGSRHLPVIHGRRRQFARRR